MLHFAYDARFDSVGAYLDAVEATRDGQAYHALGTQAMSLDPDVALRGPCLAAFVQQCRTMRGFATEIALVRTLVESLTADITPLASIKRHRTRARSGSSVNIHAVYRGDLRRAWSRMERVLTPGGVSHCVLFVPAAYTNAYSANVVRLAMACNVALVELLQASGRTCEIWAMSGNENAYGRDRGHRQLVCIKQAGEHWNIHGMVCLTSPAWYRRLGYRMAEVQQPRLTLTSGYGGRGNDFWPQLVAQTSQDLHLPAGIALLGAGTDNNIVSHTQALTWLEGVLERGIHHHALP